MKPEQFIKDHGLEKAREVVEGAPDWATGINLHSMQYFGGDKFCRGDVLILEIKRLVESVDLINKCGGIDEVNRIYVPIPPEFELKFAALIQAIKDYESIYGEEGAIHE